MLLSAFRSALLFSIFSSPNLLLVLNRTTSSMSQLEEGNQTNLFSMAFVTVPNDEIAKKIAHGLVQNKLAACVNIIPKILSVYEWEGKVNEDAELLLMIKTRTSIVSQLTTFVKENHPYDVCEVITTSIEGGNRAYLDWIGSVVKEK